MVKSKEKKCPLGEIYRKPYSRKLSRSDNIKKVKGSCIKTTSQTVKKVSDSMKLIMEKKNINNEKINRLYGDQKCKNEEIEKSGYLRREYTKKNGSKVSGALVGPSCIKRITGSKKGLKKFGYTNIKTLSTQKRQNALARPSRKSLKRNLINVSRRTNKSKVKTKGSRNSIKTERRKFMRRSKKN
jgi:hypothetical protein